MNTLSSWGATILIMLIASYAVQSQDKIYKKNKEIIECVIKEVGSEDIKYHTSEVPDGVLLSISIDKIFKIEFASGKLITFKDNFSDPENYEDQNKMALKINFLEPLIGSTSFTLERNLKPGRNIEGTLGIIGLGWDPNGYNGSGFSIGFGMKFLSKPDYYFRKMRYAHLLKGFYIKPEIYLSSYKVIPIDPDFFGGSTLSSEERVSVFMGAFLINVGKQWVFDDTFLLEIYGAVGYGNKSRNNVPQYSVFVGDDSPIAGKLGFRIGFLF